MYRCVIVGLLLLAVSIQASAFLVCNQTDGTTRKNGETWWNKHFKYSCEVNPGPTRIKYENKIIACNLTEFGGSVVDVGKSVVLDDYTLHCKQKSDERVDITMEFREISCPRGWKAYPTACYKILSQHDNYQTASSACASLNSRAGLPWFQNPQEYTDFKRYVNSAYSNQKVFQVPFAMKFNNARHLEIVTKVRNNKVTCPFRTDIIKWANNNPSKLDAFGRQEDCTEWIKQYGAELERLNDVACSYTRGKTVCQIRRNPVSCDGKNGKTCIRNIEENIKNC